MTRTPDRRVRLALPRDVAGIAAVQARAWRQSYAALVPPDALGTLREAAAARWAESIERPPTDAHHVFVALDDDLVAGLCAVAPADDPDLDAHRVGQVAVLVVDPARRGLGHGSRLLTAAADTLRAAGLAEAVGWFPEADTALVGFVMASGWEPDGARRTYEGPEGPVAEVRLRTALSP